jgi:hypothetical protein
MLFGEKLFRKVFLSPAAPMLGAKMIALQRPLLQP